MTATTITSLATMYGIVAGVWLFIAVIFTFAFYMEEEESEAKHAARHIFLAPVWIFYIIYLIARLIRGVWRLADWRNKQ